MGWYPCCCGDGTCNACDCFPCGVRFRLSATPSFVCSASFLTDDLFKSEWVYADVTEVNPNRCRAEYVTTVGTQPDITVPPGPGPASPPYSCGTCVNAPGIMTVRVVINIYGQSNCTVPCSDSDFGGATVCQFCGYQYDVDIYVEPLITGSVTQDNENWNAIAEQVIDPDRCDDWVAEASARGYAVCPTDTATTYKLQHLNSNLCPSGPILDFVDITVDLEPVEDSRNYLCEDCDGVTTGCACWWQFNPVSPQTPPCTPTTDPSFVNCIDVTFGNSWQDTDYHIITGARPDTGSVPTWWYPGYVGLDCSDLNNRVVKAVPDASLVNQHVPCSWSDLFLFIGAPYPSVPGATFTYQVMFHLEVVQSSEILFRLGLDDCWDSKGFSCSSINSWLVPDPALATFTDVKFILRVYHGTPFGVHAEHSWLSQNSFPLTDIWTSGAIAANPLKPFGAWSIQAIPRPPDCASTSYSSSLCTFTPYSSISFPSTREEEFHCRSNQLIPDVTIGPIACPP